MEYQGVIKGSRTLDLIAVGAIIDMAAASILAYSPEQLGVTVPVYLVIRVVLGAVQAVIRFKTTGPVGGEQPDGKRP